MARDLGARCILDTSGEPLRRTTSGVYLVKPSIRELRELTGDDLHDEAAQVRAARGLVDAGRCEVVVLSLGADGALVVTADAAARFAAIPVTVCSAVGAGDSMLAGITVGLGGAVLLTRLMQGVLYGVTSTDPLTFAAVAGVLLLVAVIASVIPALRATRVDPLVALRSE